MTQRSGRVPKRVSLFDRFSDRLMDSRQRRRIGTHDQCRGNASDFEFADLRRSARESGVLAARTASARSVNGFGG